MDGQRLGAHVLPIGLMMGLNAGAPAAGAGLQGLGGFAAVAGEVPGLFAGALQGVLGAAPDGEGVGPEVGWDLQQDPEAGSDVFSDALFLQSGEFAELPQQIAGDWQLEAGAAGGLGPQGGEAVWRASTGQASGAEVGVPSPAGGAGVDQGGAGSGGSNGVLPGPLGSALGAAVAAGQGDGAAPPTQPVQTLLAAAPQTIADPDVPEFRIPAASGATDVDVMPVANAGRRWQSGLPAELRAAVSNAPQAPTVNTVQTGARVDGPAAQLAAEVPEPSRILVPKRPVVLPAAEAGAENQQQAVDMQARLPALDARGIGQPAVVQASQGVEAAVTTGTGPAFKTQMNSTTAMTPEFSAGSELGEPDDVELSSRFVSRFDVGRERAPGWSAVAAPQSPGGHAGQAATAGAVAGAVPSPQMPAALASADAADVLLAADLEAGDFESQSFGSGDLEDGVDLAATVRGGNLQGAMRTDSLQMPNQAQSGQVASQVAVEIARHLKNGQSSFQMRFDPPELGRVDVRMKVAADGSVQAHLIVERPETLDMFLRDQRALERALENAGLSANSGDLQFSLKQDGDQQMASGDNGAGQGSANGQSSDGPSDGAETWREDDPENVQVHRLRLAEQRGGLDIKI